MGTISIRFKSTPEDQAFAGRLIQSLSGNTGGDEPRKAGGKFVPGSKVRGLRGHKHKTGVVLESLPSSTKLKWDTGRRASWVSNTNLELVV